MTISTASQQPALTPTDQPAGPSSDSAPDFATVLQASSEGTVGAQSTTAGRLSNGGDAGDPDGTGDASRAKTSEGDPDANSKEPKPPSVTDQISAALAMIQPAPTPLVALVLSPIVQTPTGQSQDPQSTPAQSQDARIFSAQVPGAHVPATQAAATQAPAAHPTAGQTTNALAPDANSTAPQSSQAPSPSTLSPSTASTSTLSPQAKRVVRSSMPRPEGKGDSGPGAAAAADLIATGPAAVLLTASTPTTTAPRTGPTPAPAGLAPTAGPAPIADPAASLLGAAVARPADASPMDASPVPANAPAGPAFAIAPGGSLDAIAQMPPTKAPLSAPRVATITADPSTPLPPATTRQTPASGVATASADQAGEQTTGPTPTSLTGGSVLPPATAAASTLPVDIPANTLLLEESDAPSQAPSERPSRATAVTDPTAAGTTAQVSLAAPALAPAQSAAPATAPAYTSAAELPAQLTGPLVNLRAAGDGTRRIVIQLHPRDLGSVGIEVSVREGAMSVSVTSASESTRATIAAALPTLHQQLADAGISGVKVAIDSSSAYSAGGGASGGQQRQWLADQSPMARTPGTTSLSAGSVSTDETPTPARTRQLSTTGVDRWL